MAGITSLAVCALVLGTLALVQGQRITTIQLDGVQYFVSRMNPYSPELNYFLAYQYCRSLGLQLTSFESKEKSDSITQYLRNAGYNQYDFWTSGNRLGTDMFLWMSTGLPFNATFDLMNVPADESAAQPIDAVVMTSEQPAPPAAAPRLSPPEQERPEQRVRGPQGAGPALVRGRLYRRQGLHLRADPLLLLQLRLHPRVLLTGPQQQGQARAGDHHDDDHHHHGRTAFHHLHHDGGHHNGRAPVRLR